VKLADLRSKIIQSFDDVKVIGDQTQPAGKGRPHRNLISLMPSMICRLLRALISADLCKAIVQAVAFALLLWGFFALLFGLQVNSSCRRTNVPQVSHD
jgi:hypothetical protein